MGMQHFFSRCLGVCGLPEKRSRCFSGVEKAQCVIVLVASCSEVNSYEANEPHSTPLFTVISLTPVSLTHSTPLTDT